MIMTTKTECFYRIECDMLMGYPPHYKHICTNWVTKNLFLENYTNFTSSKRQGKNFKFYKKVETISIEEFSIENTEI